MTYSFTTLPTITITNPILRGMYPDPSWIWDDVRNQAILVNSSFELIPGLPLHASESLDVWQPIGYAVDNEMAQRLLIPFVSDSGGLYAPTLRRIRDRYVIACTVACIEEDAARDGGVDEATLQAVRESEGNFIITADTLEGPWQGPFWVQGAQGIDPDIMEDRDGTVYWTQTRPALHPRWEGQTEVWTQRIDPETWQLIESHDMRGNYGKTVIWNGFGAEAVWTEGPHLYRIGDWIYLMTAEGGTSFDHSEMIMRTHVSGSLHDTISAWIKAYEHDQGCDITVRLNERSVVGYTERLFHANKKNPFLTHRQLGTQERVQCVGHADLLHHPQLGWWLTCLASRETTTVQDIPLSFLGRETFLAPLEWQHDPANWNLQADGEPTHDDSPGWPVVAGGVGRLIAELEIDSGNGQICAMQIHDDDDAYLLLDQRNPLPMDLALQTVRVRKEQRVYRRISEDRYVVLCPTEGSVQIRQDSVHWIDIQVQLAQSYVQVTLGRGETVETKRYPIVLSTSQHVMATFAYGNLNIEGVNDTERPTAIERLAVIDARFMSTEWSGGFVGCLISTSTSINGL